MANGALRKKLEGPLSARPPVADIARLASQFARLVEESLRKVLGSRPDIQVVSAIPQKRRAAQDSAAEDDYLASAFISGALAGAVVLAPTFAFRLIEIMTGAASAPQQDETVGEAAPRTLTAIDRALLQEPTSVIFEAFIDAMPVHPPSALRSAFQSPRLSPIGELSDDEGAVDGLAIVLSVALAGGTEKFELPIFMPLSTLDFLESTEPSRTAVQTTTPSAWSRTMLTAARNAPFRMVGVLHEKQMSIGDIKDMKVGGVIPLPADHRMQIDLRIDAPQGVANEPTVGGGVLGVVDGQRAVRLTAPADPDFLTHLDVLRTG